MSDATKKKWMQETSKHIRKGALRRLAEAKQGERIDVYNPEVCKKIARNAIKEEYPSADLEKIRAHLIKMFNLAQRYPNNVGFDVCEGVALEEFDKIVKEKTANES